MRCSVLPNRQKENLLRKHASDTYEILKEKIISGEFYPSQHLVESKLAKELDASRDHIRMAFQRLEADGLITLLPNQGASVAEPSLEDTVDTVIAQGALSLEAFRRAMTNINGDQNALQELRALLDEMEKGIAEHDFSLYASAAHDFKIMLLDLADSPRIKELYERLRITIGRIRIRNIIIPIRGAKSLHEHQAIFNAIADSDPETLDKVTRAYFLSVRTDIEKYWDILNP